jgi:2-dehydro-3-deoxygluconokinase
MAAAFDAFPKLQVVASTFRNLSSVGEQELTGVLYRRGAPPLFSAPVRLSGVVDRIGGGDAFAAGLLYGLHAGRSDADALTLAMASTAFKHSVPGDFSLATLADLEALMAGGLDVRR